MSSFAEFTASTAQWQATGLRFSTFQQTVSTEHCYSGWKEFQGCIHGLNAVLERQTPPKALFPSSRVAVGSNRNPLAGELEEAYGQAQVRRVIRATGTTPRLVFQRFREERDRDRAAWEALFADKEQRLDFALIASDIKTSAIDLDPTREGMLTAEAFNGYYSAARDPHTRLVPSSILPQHVRQSTTAQSFFIAPAPRAVTVVGAMAGTNGKLGYIRLQDFMSGNPYTAMRSALRTVVDRGATGLILDLRGNRGGLLQAAIDILSLFVPRGQAVVTLNRYSQADDPDVLGTLLDLGNWLPLNTLAFALGQQVVFRTQRDPVTTMPLVILVDADSASASELVSGALQDISADDWPRALVVGVPTFGKGTAQSPMPWRNHANVHMWKTTAYFNLPSGRTNQIVTIVPDVTAYRVPEPTEDDRFALREADRYVTALPNAGPAWAPAHPARVRAINECVRARGTARARFDAARAQNRTIDYQALVAQDTLVCRME